MRTWINDLIVHTDIGLVERVSDLVALLRLCKGCSL